MCVCVCPQLPTLPPPGKGNPTCCGRCRCQRQRRSGTHRSPPVSWRALGGEGGAAIWGGVAWEWGCHGAGAVPTAAVRLCPPPYHISCRPPPPPRQRFGAVGAAPQLPPSEPHPGAAAATAQGEDTGAVAPRTRRSPPRDTRGAPPRHGGGSVSPPEHCRSCRSSEPGGRRTTSGSGGRRKSCCGASRLGGWSLEGGRPRRVLGVFAGGALGVSGRFWGSLGVSWLGPGVSGRVLEWPEGARGL